MTLAQAIREHVRRSKLEPATKTSYLSIAAVFDKFLRSDVTKLEPQHLTAALNIRRQQGISESRLRLEYAVARLALSAAGEWHRFAEQVKKPRPGPPPGRALTAGEAKLLLLVARSRPSWRRTADVIELALNTAMREGEIRELRKQDVDLLTARITLRTTKNKRPRAIPLNAAALSVLTPRCMREGSQSTDRLFSNEGAKGCPWAKTWRRITATAGLPDLRFHDLRHTAISLLGRKNVPAATIRAIAGHLDPSMTDLYTHPGEEGMRAALDEILTEPRQNAPGRIAEGSVDPEHPPRLSTVWESRDDEEIIGAGTKLESNVPDQEENP